MNILEATKVTVWPNMFCFRFGSSFGAVLATSQVMKSQHWTNCGLETETLGNASGRASDIPRRSECTRLPVATKSTLIGLAVFWKLSGEKAIGLRWMQTAQFGPVLQ
ncbi:hypothetical protein [Ruegeria lacuscaerulensis]|uniref:hypothetical protein n=1 Tax=Ruegeria lacuscaerulensis TaxID=55218 RepID=UPI00147DDD5A|nr:hypothetical protein [Ruegeria lacuscaerulensis]